MHRVRAREYGLVRTCTDLYGPSFAEGFGGQAAQGAVRAMCSGNFTAHGLPRRSVDGRRRGDCWLAEHFAQCRYCGQRMSDQSDQSDLSDLSDLSDDWHRALCGLCRRKRQKAQDCVWAVPQGKQKHRAVCGLCRRERQKAHGLPRCSTACHEAGPDWQSTMRSAECALPVGRTKRLLFCRNRFFGTLFEERRFFFCHGLGLVRYLFRVFAEHECIPYQTLQILTTQIQVDRIRP